MSSACAAPRASAAAVGVGYSPGIVSYRLAVAPGGSHLRRRRTEQAAAQAADPASKQMELAEHDEQPKSAEPCVAAAAASHKRQAVAAGTA
eukprot:2566545-Prymnesium_polylepis.1